MVIGSKRRGRERCRAVCVLYGGTRNCFFFRWWRQKVCARGTTRWSMVWLGARHRPEHTDLRICRLPHMHRFGLWCVRHGAKVIWYCGDHGRQTKTADFVGLWQSCHSLYNHTSWEVSLIQFVQCYLKGIPYTRHGEPKSVRRVILERFFITESQKFFNLRLGWIL